MVTRSKNNIPAGQDRPLTAIKMQSGFDRACVKAHQAEPVIPINVELHQRLSRLGGAQASP